jgi:hypothetical protein
MQAGRELDVKVAQSLGYDVFEADGEYWVAVDDETADPLEHFSTTWEGMGVLVEEARKQGILIDVLAREDGYIAVWGRRWADNVKCNEAPHAVSLGFLKAKGIAI